MNPQILSFLRIYKSLITRKSKRFQLIHCLFLMTLHCLIKNFKTNIKVWISQNNCNIIAKELVLFDFSPPLLLSEDCPC